METIKIMKPAAHTSSRGDTGQLLISNVAEDHLDLMINSSIFI